MSSNVAVVRRRVLVSGRVQGVGYRASAHLEARQSHPELKGWVRNLADGRVEAVFEGAAASVDAMIAWCRRGPSHAQVVSLEVFEEKAGSERLDSRFEIRK